MATNKLHPLAEAMGYKSMAAFYKDHPENFLGKDNGYKFGGPIKKYRLGGTDSSTDMGSTMYSTPSGNTISPGAGYGTDHPGSRNDFTKYTLNSSDVAKGVGVAGQVANVATQAANVNNVSDAKNVGKATAGIATGLVAAQIPVVAPIAVASEITRGVIDSTNPETSYQTKDGKQILARTDKGGDVAEAAYGTTFSGGIEGIAEDYASGDSKRATATLLGSIFGGFGIPGLLAGLDRNNQNKERIAADKALDTTYTSGSSDFYGVKDSTGYKYGGPMLTQKYGQGGTILKDYMSIVGPSHNNGGVTLQKMKNGGPMETNKELEGPEVVVKDTSGNPYVLSASLFDSKDTKGFAQGQKKDMKPGLFRPYDSSITGPDIARKTQERVERHKALRAKLGLNGEEENPAENAAEGGIEEPMMKYGGKMKYAGGGPYDFTMGYESIAGGTNADGSTYGLSGYGMKGNPNATLTQAQDFWNQKANVVPNFDKLPNYLQTSVGDWTYNTKGTGNLDPRIGLMQYSGTLDSLGGTEEDQRAALANDPALLEKMWKESGEADVQRYSNSDWTKNSGIGLKPQDTQRNFNSGFNNQIKKQYDNLTPKNIINPQEIQNYQNAWMKRRDNLETYNNDKYFSNNSQQSLPNNGLQINPGNNFNQKNLPILAGTNQGLRTAQLNTFQTPQERVALRPGGGGSSNAPNGPVGSTSPSVGGPTTTSFDTSTISPTETKPGWGSYAQLLGPLATIGVGLFGKKGKVTAHQMAPATQDTTSILRPNLQASADLAYGNLRAVGKGSGLGKGAYQNMMLQGITGINRNYGNTLADVIAKDTTANAAYKQQANAANQNVNMSAQDKRQQETDMGTTLALQGANALSTTIGGIGKDGTSMAMDYRKYKDLISLFPSIFSGKKVVIKGDQVSVS